MTTLLGCPLVTDWKPLEDLLELIKNDNAAQLQFDKQFPGMLSAVFRGLRDMQDKRLRPGIVVYRNFRVQVWPQAGFDADPTQPIRVIPEGIEVG